ASVRKLYLRPKLYSASQSLPVHSQMSLLSPSAFPVPPSVSISLVPSSSQPCLLCSVMDFYPARVQLRWFQGQQELSGRVVATDVIQNGDWIYQLLVLLETPLVWGHLPCQVEHVSLEQMSVRGFWVS
uniref:Immunoglobulin C1-set domain-containing protein n=1 Tax=Malurus cyaneus samueli TaxID=2593467 RepID=A0A8C5TRC1_9PASS